MSNYHITPPDWTSWLAQDEWRYYTYKRMEKGYTVETLLEDEFIERYLQECQERNT